MISPSSRPPLSPLTGKRVLITGAGGSIGCALAHAVAARHPASLLLLDASEFALYTIDRTLAAPHIATLGNVQDERLLEDLFTQHKPQIILHTAACKHVPLLEQNPFAALTTNVLGTRALLQAASRHLAEHFVLLSTDKAVQPHSMLGASKRIAELLLLTHPQPSPALSIVRLCNVWASHGSVVELFEQQIAQGLPLTLTDPSATRFFLSLDQAVAAILSALAPRPAGILLIPRPAPAVSIAQLAHELLKTHAATLPIVTIGPRPGDKPHEALLAPNESALPLTDTLLHPITSPTPTNFAAHLAALERATLHRDLPALLAAILTLVPDYKPSALITRQSPHEA